MHRMVFITKRIESQLLQNGNLNTPRKRRRDSGENGNLNEPRKRRRDSRGY